MSSARNLYSSGLAWLHAQLRAAFGQEALVCAIYARNPVRGGYTDTTPDPVVIAPAVPCLLRPLRAEAAALQGRDVARAWAQVYFTTDPGVTREHILEINGVRYAPVATIPLDVASGLYRVDCTEIQG